MEKEGRYRYELCCSMPKYVLLILVLIRCSVDGDGQCRDYTFGTEANENPVYENHCVSNLLCIHYKDKIDISWNSNGTIYQVIDISIALSKVRINGTVWRTDGEGNEFAETVFVQTEFKNVTVMNTFTDPEIEFNKDYIATVGRRYSHTGVYRISEACTKDNRTNITSKATNNSVGTQHATISQTTYRQNTTKQLTKPLSKIDPDYNPATTSQGTRGLVTKHKTRNLVSTSHTTYWQGANKHLTMASDKNGLNNSSAESGAPFLVIGLSVAGMVLLLVIVVIIVMLRRKIQSGNEVKIRKGKQKTDVENNGPDEDDTYNHLSFDNQDGNAKRAKQKSHLHDNNADDESTYNHLSRDNEERKTKLAKQKSYLKNNEVDEEGTYSHMSRDYEETSTSMAQGNEEDTYNHLSLCPKTGENETMSGEINVISVSVHAPTTLENAGKNEEIQVKTEKRNETDTVTGVDETESAAGFKQLNSTEDDIKGPSRRKGPKGDLYTEIEIK